uniref:Uncharacterized protein n=1 Tax=Romanomermis culicivorax TaxID=13658 RepID=A0A915KIN4_ROMCU
MLEMVVRLPGLRYPIDLTKDRMKEDQKKSMLAYQPEYVPGYKLPFFENILPSDQPGIQITHIGNKVVVMQIESGHMDDQIKGLGRRKLARKANRAKKREGEDVVEISDDEGEKTESMASADSKFVGLTTLLTDSTKSRTKTTPTSQMLGSTSSTSKVQSMVATARVPSKSAMLQCPKLPGKIRFFRPSYFEL